MNKRRLGVYLFLIAAFLSFLFSVSLWFSGHRDEGAFVGLYDRLTGNNAEIQYDFEKMHIQVPSGTGAEAGHAEWMLNGKLKISTQQKTSSPN